MCGHVPVWWGRCRGDRRVDEGVSLGDVIAMTKIDGADQVEGASRYRTIRIAVRDQADVVIEMLTPCTQAGTLVWERADPVLPD